MQEFEFILKIKAKSKDEAKSKYKALQNTLKLGDLFETAYLFFKEMIEEELESQDSENFKSELESEIESHARI